jgi:bifunctional DNA-binding transcriptional regulator/antitoxin component of YhaV-PrlF toxin-antitoxin module
VLPADLRERLGIREDDRLLARVEEDGSLRVITARAAWESVRGILKDRLPHLGDRSLADELIAERRTEAARG